MRQPVRREGLGRQEAARHLVLALGAALEGLDALLDAEFERLVVGRLEMQAGYVFQLAPVAAVQRVGAVDHERSGNGAALTLGDHEQDILGHGPADAAEEIQVQVGRRIMRGIGVAVAAVEQLPVRVRGIRAAHPAQRHARFRHLAPLGADVLALLLLERGEELVEACVARIEPVELHAAAQHEAGLLQLARMLLGREQDVGRRDLGGALGRIQHGDQRRARRSVHRQQTRSGHRREWHRRQQLRVVVEAMALVGVGPGPVEDI